MKAFLIVLVFIVSCFGVDIEIKGLKVGMDISEAQKLYSLKTSSYVDNGKSYFLEGKKITLAGSDIFDLIVKLKENKIDVIEFTLYSNTFENVKDAIKEKYKNLECKNSEFKNKLGNSLTQTICTISDDKSVLILKKFFELNIDRSILEIRSIKNIQEIKKNNELNKKDI